MINIYDANAFLRRSLNRAELGTTAMDPRILYYRIMAATDPEFWVWDGPNNNVRRRALFPGYKIRDYDGQENIFAGLEIYRELLTHSRVVQITVPNWEADDVCATLAKAFSKRGEQVTVHTNDFDFQQLRQYPGVTVKGIGEADNIPTNYVSLYKAMVGDKSDKIPGIPGFGGKTFFTLKDIWPVLDQALRSKDIETFRNQPWKPAVKAWLADDANIELLCIYHQITQMLDVPFEEIQAHMKPGLPNPQAAEQLFARFMF